MKRAATAKDGQGVSQRSVKATKSSWRDPKTSYSSTFVIPKKSAMGTLGPATSSGKSCSSPGGVIEKGWSLREIDMRSRDFTHEWEPLVRNSFGTHQRDSTRFRFLKCLVVQNSTLLNKVGRSPFLRDCLFYLSFEIHSFVI